MKFVHLPQKQDLQHIGSRLPKQWETNGSSAYLRHPSKILATLSTPCALATSVSTGKGAFFAMFGRKYVEILRTKGPPSHADGQCSPRAVRGNTGSRQVDPKQHTPLSLASSTSRQRSSSTARSTAVRRRGRALRLAPKETHLKLKRPLAAVPVESGQLWQV